MRQRTTVGFAIVLSLINYFSFKACAQNINFICNAQTSCDDCVTASPSCSWCADPINFDGPRCYAASDASVTCSDPQSPRSELDSTSDDMFTDTNQIIPRDISVSLRRGEPVTFNLSIQPAPNFPLDLYLLMDLSYSMRDDLSNLKVLGDQIATTISSITTNFQLGFGTFVDKPLASYTDSTPDRLQDPCNANCEAVYSYKHIVSLTNNSNEFNDRVQAQVISGNLDSPEGGFDGFLQSIVCDDLIGWRDESRKLLLYITDAGFHYAGDGKLGGVIVPHNGQCLMGQQVDRNNPVYYNDYGVYDYPSIGQIRQNLRDMDIIPIFAATTGASSFYTALASELEGGIVGTLASDSSNVVQLIQDSYNNVSQRVIISPDSLSNIAVNVTPTFCPSLDENGICEGLQIGSRADFNITVSLLQCLDEDTPQTLNVRVLGFGSFRIRITQLCNCTCQSERNVSSPLCTNGNGTLECGVCICNPGRFGDLCQCDATGTANNMNTTCLNGPNGLMCSGRGVCICGNCECQELPGDDMFFGKACECDNFQCDRDPVTGLTCGGPDRGVCTCDGQCECLNSPISGLQFTGSSCDCSPDNNTCIDTSSENVICSGNGECMCGECYCDNGYTGQFCEICTNITVCPVASCNANQLCVQCAYNITTEGCEECTFEMIDTEGETDIEINGNAAVTCDFTDDDGCEYRFFVALDSDGNTEPVNVDNARECPTRIEPWIIAVSIIGALLLLGLITLIIIKIILMILDHIEVKNFMKEVQDPSFRKNENPLFQSPNKEYKNPVYGQ